MTILSALRRRLPAGADAGITLAEVMVSMTIMAIFMAISTGGLISLYRTANSTIAAGDAQAALNTAFLRLDRAIRYSSGISEPGTVDGDFYVEFLTTNSGTPICTQLRAEAGTGLLLQRSWTQNSVPLMPGAWTTLADGLSPAAPFSVIAPDGSFNYQRLKIAVTAGSGAGDNAASRQIDVTFTLLNTTLSTYTPSVCTEGRSIA